MRTETIPYYRMVRLEGQTPQGVKKGRRFKIDGRRKNYLSLSESVMSADVWDTYFAPQEVVEEQPETTED